MVTCPTGTNEKILDDLVEIMKETNDVITHTGTNVFKNNVKLLNNAKNILRVVSKNYSSTNLMFLSRITGKDNKNIKKNLIETNARLKRY